MIVSQSFYESSESPLILVIEDDLFMQQILQHFLEQENYCVVKASNGQEGLEMYSKLHPDMVLLDAMMPVMDGFECCTRLKTLIGGEHTPILIITGLEDTRSVNQAFAVGAIDYVTKPIHWAVLRQRVHRLIEQAQLWKKLEAANLELQKLAKIDSLTQIANRRSFDEHLQREWLRAARERHYLSLILCDIDYFKLYNDHFGHQLGDDCLYQVAQAINQGCKRPIDLAARYGGEEFAIILPCTSDQGALKVAEYIRERVQSLQLPHERSPISEFVTLSCGASSMIPSRQSMAADLIASADQALYAAKREGRDRVKSYSPCNSY